MPTHLVDVDLRKACQLLTDATIEMSGRDALVTTVRCDGALIATIAPRPGYRGHPGDLVGRAVARCVEVLRYHRFEVRAARSTVTVLGRRPAPTDLDTLIAEADANAAETMARIQTGRPSPKIAAAKAADDAQYLSWKAEQWARKLDPARWDVNRAGLLRRIAEGHEAVRSRAYLAALDQVIAESGGRWVEPTAA